MNKEQALSNLSAIVEKCAKHPYILTKDNSAAASYCDLGYELSEAWCEMAHATGFSKAKSFKLSKSTKWDHDYNASFFKLRYYTSTVVDKYGPYHRQIVKMVTDFLNTGKLDYIYCLGHNDSIVTYKWFTEKECGIASLHIPGFFPIYSKMLVDEELAAQYFKKTISPDRYDDFMKRWKANDLPMNKYLSAHYPVKEAV